MAVEGTIATEVTEAMEEDTLEVALDIIITAIITELALEAEESDAEEEEVGGSDSLCFVLLFLSKNLI